MKMMTSGCPMVSEEEEEEEKEEEEGGEKGERSGR